MSGHEHARAQVAHLIRIGLSGLSVSDFRGAGLLALLWLAVMSWPVNASAEFEVTALNHPLTQAMEWFEDPHGEVQLADILAKPQDYEFTPVRDGTPQTVYEAVWLRVSLNFADEAQGRTYYMFNRLGNIYDLRFYRQQADGSFSEIITGNAYPRDTREVNSLRYGFEIEAGAAPVQLYIRQVGGPGTNNLPWNIIESNLYRKAYQALGGFNIAAISAIAALFFFNLILALSLRKAEYLYYVAYVGSVTMALVTYNGIGFFYLWPDSPALNERMMHSMNLMSAGLRLLTIASFIGLATLAPRLWRATLGMLGCLALVLCLLIQFGISSLPTYVATLPWGIAILFSFVLCGVAIKRSVKLAIPLTLAMAVPTVCAVAEGIIVVNSADVTVLQLQLSKAGFVVHVLMFSLCLAAHIKDQGQSRMQALHDSLTGLPGITLLHERFDLATQLSRRQDMSTAVLFMDLDGFKAVNDQHGHGLGDELLQQVARRLRKTLRRSDTAARIGGDEFVLLLPQLSKTGDAFKVAEKLLSVVSAPYVLGDVEARISASIGIALCPEHGGELTDLKKLADQAMYEAKRRGKNTYTLAPTNLVPLQAVGHVVPRAAVA